MGCPNKLGPHKVGGEPRQGRKWASGRKAYIHIRERDLRSKAYPGLRGAEKEAKTGYPSMQGPVGQERNLEGSWQRVPEPQVLAMPGYACI